MAILLPTDVKDQVLPQDSLPQTGESDDHGIATSLLRELLISNYVEDIAMYILKKDDIEAARSIWQYLEAKIDSVGSDTSWTWVETWLKNYGDLVDYWFVVGAENGLPCGITLITKEQHRQLPLPVSAFHVGTNGAPYKDQADAINNKVLVRKDCTERFLAAVVETITTEFKWEEINFNAYDPSQANLLVSLLQKRGIRFTTARESCRYYDLNIPRKNNNTILCNLSSDVRYKIKRCMRAFDNDLLLEWAETSEQAMDIFQEMIILYEKTWLKRGRRGMFSSSRFSNFHREYIQRSFPNGSVILLRVKSQKYGTLGCLYLTVDGGVAYGCQGGINDFEDTQIGDVPKKRMKIGFIVHTMAMQACLQRGLKAYNFSTGEYAYKHELTNGTTEVVTISLRRSVKPYVRDGFINFYTKLDSHKHASLLTKIVHVFV